MATPIPSVQNTPRIASAEFVSLLVTFTNGTTQIQRSLHFSSSYKPETISGITYRDLGALMAVGTHQRDITSTNYDTAIGITGIDPYYIYWVAGGPATAPVPVPGQADIPIGYYPMIKGSTVTITRGFYNDNYILTGNALRFTGIVTSYSIQEQRDSDIAALNDTYTIALQCSSYLTVLENRVAGRKTNSVSWKYFNPSDTSMDRVAGLENKQFDFGKPVEAGTGGSVGGSSGGTTIETTYPVIDG